MLRLKASEPGLVPPPQGNWLAGMMIGSAILGMATQAVLLGATAALNNPTVKGG